MPRRRVPDDARPPSDGTQTGCYTSHPSVSVQTCVVSFNRSSVREIGRSMEASALRLLQRCVLRRVSTYLHLLLSFPCVFLLVFSFSSFPSPPSLPLPPGPVDCLPIGRRLCSRPSTFPRHCSEKGGRKQRGGGGSWPESLGNMGLHKRRRSGPQPVAGANSEPLSIFSERLHADSARDTPHILPLWDRRGTCPAKFSDAGKKKKRKEKMRHVTPGATIGPIRPI